MKIEIDIDDTKLQNLSRNAYDQLISISKKYAEDILEEASRLEATRNSAGNTPEVTATIIRDAVDFANKYRRPKKKVFIQVILQLLNFILTAFTGALFDIDKFNDPQKVYWFLGVFLAAIIVNFIIYYKDYSDD
jgi:hypothetical protein